MLLGGYATPSPLLVGGVVLLYIIGSYVYAWSRLRHIKGPVLGSFSYAFILRTELAFRQGDSWANVIKKYGDPVRIGPNDLLTGDANVIRRINGVRSTYTRSDFYETPLMDPDHPNLFALIDTKAHDELKAKMSHGYGGREVPQLERDIDEQVQTLVDLLRSKYAQKGKLADFTWLSLYFALDAITSIAYGKSFGYLQQEKDIYGHIVGAKAFIKVATITSEIPWMGRLLRSKTVMNLLGPKATDKRGVGVLFGSLLSGSNPRKPMEAICSHGVSQRECESEIPFQIMAGSDTTARSFRGTLLYLMSTPQAYSTLQKEIDAAINAGRISQPATAMQCRDLPYLQACIYEGLRLTVPTTILLTKKAPPEGDTIGPHSIPGGTRISVAIKAIMQDTSVFGRDANIYRPERWIGLEPAQRRSMLSTVELVFGYGRWGCSGKPVALMELNKVFTEVGLLPVWRFDKISSDPRDDARHACR
ncbi:hypothetical protein CHU98_g6655 [Xylaria longipes]|nr:hypothetical protein CHU98_g6655 [Xylaria longipes]